MPTETTTGPGAEVRPLEWDTRHFGFPIALVESRSPSPAELRRAVAAADESGVRCLYLLCDAGATASASAAAAHGFDFVDLRVTLERKGPAGAAVEVPVAGSGLGARGAVPNDLDLLLPMARTSFTASRFFVDGRFPREAVERLFATWVEREVTEPEGLAFVVERAGAAVGFASGRLEGNDRGRVGLVAVSGEARGAGVGRAAVTALVAGLSSRGARDVSVVTQGRNAPAIRLYEDTGFRTVSVQLWFHRWR